MNTPDWSVTTAAADAVGQQWIPSHDSLVLSNRPLRPNVAAVSRFRDDRWDLGPAVFAPHLGACSIPFGQAPAAFRVVLKHVCWLMINHDGSEVTVTRMSPPRPAILSIWTEFRYMRVFTEWLTEHGFVRFGDVSLVDLDEYLTAVKNNGLTLDMQQTRLTAVMKLWAYRSLLDPGDRLPEAPPWHGERLHHLLEGRRSQELTTPRISPPVMNALLGWALRFIEDLAADITAAIRADQRLADRTRPGQGRDGRYRRQIGEVATDLHGLVRAFSRLNIPLPGVRSATTGEIDYHYGFLARLIDADVRSLHTPASQAVLHDCGLPIREGSPLLLLPSGLVDGQRWRDDPIDESETRPLARHLMAACFIVIAYLSGMRPGEVLSLERDCLHRNPDSGLLLMTGRHWKGVRDDAGELVPEGEIRRDPWVVAEPVAVAVTALENLHDEQLLFPNRLGARTETGARFRDGRARGHQNMSNDLNAFRDWVNDYCARTGRTDTIPIDAEHPSIQPRQFRRTLAWFIARKPRGIIAAAIQYGHVKVQMTVGYAGTYASGFPDDLAFEELLARLDMLADSHEHLTAGEHVSGPAADQYRHRVQDAQRFAGHVLTTRREARGLFSNPDLQIYPGTGMTCVFDPKRAACRVSRDDTDAGRTPDLSDCRSHCANIARTDRDIDVLREQATQLAETANDPMSPEPRTIRYLHELDRLRTLIDEHDHMRPDSDD